MGTHAGPKLVTGSMSFYVDAASKKSLTTIGNGWRDLMGNTPNLAFSAATFSAVNGGIVTFAGTPGSSASTTFNQSTDMTWDVWFKRTASVGSGTNFNMVFESALVPYFSFGWAGTSADRFLFSWNTKFGTATAVQQTLSPATLYSNNVWYNVTCTLKFDLAATTSTGNIYVNGVLVATSTSTVNSVDTVGFQSLNGGVMRLATYGAAGVYPFNGSISNLKIYRRILTATEIQQNYNATAQRFQPDVAELAVYHIDAANSNSLTRIQNGWTDLSNNKNALSFTGATFDSANGGVITFDGNTGSSASVAQSFYSTSSRTYDVWFKRDQSMNDYNMVWGHFVPYLAFRSNGEFQIAYNTRNGVSGQGQTDVFSGTTFNNNVWYNVTCTIEYNFVATTSTSKIYVNGVLVRSSTTGVGSVTLPILGHGSVQNQLIMGNWYFSNPYPFKGSISNFRIYDRVLTDNEIVQSYNALKARFGY